MTTTSPPGGPFPLLLLLLLVAAVGGCGEREVAFDIVDVRPIGAGPSARREGPWRYELPDGWSARAARGDATLAFEIADREGTECTLRVLEGTGGGTVAIVNRMRRERGREPLAAGAVEALPRAALLGMPTPLVELEGLLALVLVLDVPDVSPATFFLALAGPKGDVNAERARFLELAASLRPPGRADAESPPSAVTPSALAWTAPEGWQDLGPRRMREVTFAPAGTKGTEIYVAVLSGTGGGLAANVNRWRGDQMGQTPLGSEALAALPRLEVLGTEGVLVEIEGDFRGGMGAKAVEDAMMLALVVERGDSTIFVKMIGPADEVRPEREAFEAFCRSLQVRK